MVPFARISSVLYEGLIIYTKPGTSGAWYRNIIQKFEQNEVSIPLIKPYVENTILPDSNITIKYSNEYFEYIIEGVVTKISPDQPSSVTINILNAEELVNTRTTLRYYTNLPTFIRHIWHDEKHYSVITNISLGGMAFVCKHEFDYGDEYDIAIYINDYTPYFSTENNYITLKGKIIRKSVKKSFIDYSMQFTEVPEISMQALARYISLLEENNSSLKESFLETAKGITNK